MREILSALVVGMVLSLGSPQALAQTLALEGATLYDGSGAGPVRDAVVLIEDEQVVCAGSREQCPVPEEVRRRDLSGKWLMPGLVDTHVHLWQTGFFDSRPDAADLRDAMPYMEGQTRQRRNPDRYFDAWLCSGITAAFDVGGYPWSVDRARELDGRDDRPHLAATGPLISHAPREIMNLPGEKVMLSMDSPAEAREAVAYIASLEADAVKLWFLPVTDPERQEAIDERVLALGEAAREHGIRLFTHATSLREAKVALESGTDVLVHGVFEEALDAGFLEAAAAADVIYVPTMIVSGGYLEAFRAMTGEADFALDDPHDCVDPDTRELLEGADRFADHPEVRQRDADWLAAFAERIAAQEETMAENLRAVHEAGIAIAVGTDAGNPGTVHGPSIYAELEAMQAAGVPPEELIPMVTREGARVMGREQAFGTLASGRQADLIVLGGDPGEDITHVRLLEGVMRAGRWVREP